MPEGIEAECHRCEYEWEYTGKMVKATCPSCGAKVTVRSFNDGE